MMQRVSNRTRGRVVILVALALTLITVDAMAFPSARRNSAMVWSDDADGIILFGGLSPADAALQRYEFGDTWKFTGLRWVQLYPQDAPSPRYGMSMSYDSNRDRILLFGGAAGTDFFSDTWVYEEGNWARIDPPVTPPARRFGGIAFDPVRDRVVLFGGGIAEGRLFDTWEFDGTSWILIQADGPHVELPSLVYDAARNETIMTGLEGSTVVMYRYGNGAWTRIEPETLLDCVGQTQMVFRDHDGTVLSYGGSCVSGGISSDTWVWDGTNWSEQTVLRNAGALFGYALAHDRKRNQSVLYGGVGFAEEHNTFRLSGNRWIRFTTVYDPGPRTQFVLRPSLDGDGLLFFGGQNAVDFRSDFWTLEDLRWDRASLKGTPPGGCIVPAGAVDPVRGRLVVVCFDSKTYEFDGAEWELKDTTGAPPVRRWSVMEWDPASRKILLYGGFDNAGGYLNETWTFDGTEWKKLELKKGQRPPARMLATMFLDPQSNRLIVVGGIGRPDFNSDFERYEDQWQFDGTKWILMNPATKLPQRYGAQVATDPITGRVLVFGGKSKEEKFLNDLWAWNGANWTEVDDGPAPAPRMNGRMAWDPAVGKIVLYGGYAGLYYSDLWTFDGIWARVESDPTPRRPTRRPGGSESSGSEGLMSTPDVSSPVSFTPPIREELR